MKRTIFFLTGATIIFLSLSTFASSIIPTDLDKMSHKAGRIFYGRCVDAKVAKDENGIFSTYVTYEVIRDVKGVSGSTVNFKVFGDATGGNSDQPATIVGLGRFTPGDEDVLFLYEESPWGFTSPVGLWQGSFPVKQTEDGPRISERNGMAQGSTEVDSKTYKATNKKITTPDDLLDEVEDILSGTN